MLIKFQLIFSGGKQFIMPKKHKCMTDGNAFFFFYSWQGLFLAKWLSLLKTMNIVIHTYFLKLNRPIL